MGNVCGTTHELGGRTKASDENVDEGGARAGKVHLLVLALDYPGTGHELTCTEDGRNMTELARACGVEDITVLENNDCYSAKVEAKIREVGGRCEPGDYFVFNYSGHGTSVKDMDGDEKDGMDEALCLVTETGELDFDQFMTDDDFAEIVTDAVAPGVKILILCDCCHSGTIGDFSSEAWEGHEAISMSGCKDDQTSGDTGRGGIWTHSLLLAVEQMQNDGQDDYSVGQLYNVQLDKDDETFNSAQDIQIKWTSDLESASHMAWPFVVPEGCGYKAPWNP